MKRERKKRREEKKRREKGYRLEFKLGTFDAPGQSFTTRSRKTHRKKLSKFYY